MAQQISRRNFLRLSTAGAAVSLLAACAPAAAPQPSAAPAATPTPVAAAAPVAAETKVGGGTLTFGYSQITSYSHFMHLREYAGGEWIYAKNWACSRLVSFNREEGYIPDLAESWELSDDGMTLTFYLAKGVEWHDGAPFTAADVEFTFMMMSMPNLGPYNKGRGFSSYVVGMSEFIDDTADTISGLRVLDDHTVVFDLLEPKNTDVLLRPFTTVTMAPKHILNQYLDRDKSADILQSPWATSADFVGTGPFRVVEYVPDQYIVYEPYDQYHRGKPLLDRLIYRSFADAQTMAAALENGEIDASAVPPTELERFRGMDHLNFRLNGDNPAVSGFPINVRQPYLADKRVRQALLHAIDRETMNQVLLAGAGQVIDTRYEQPVRFGISPNLKRYEYNPELAKQLLAEAEADGAWDPNTVLRWTIQSVPSNSSTFEAINGYWADVGVKADFHVLGSDLSAQASGPDWNFDFYMSGYPIGHPSWASDHLNALSPACDYVCTGYEDARFHELLEKSTQVLPDEEMKAIIWELQELVSEAAIFIILYRGADVYGINKRVHELKAGYTTMDYYDWEIEKTWVEEA